MNEQQPVVVRKPVVPPADVAYAHKLGRGMLLPEQIMELVKAINPAYVAETKQGQNYLAHHQARAEMNRIFGYGNWDTDADAPVMLWESAEADSKSKSGFYYRACYRGKVVVHVRDLWGMPVASYTGTHAEANSNLPDRGEAHAMAITSLESYALRRALLNMGDRFGLGLYNKGSMLAHGQYTIQLQPGILSTWEQGAPAMPTHETIRAEQAVDTTYISERVEDQPPAEPQTASSAILQSAVPAPETNPSAQAVVGGIVQDIASGYVEQQRALQADGREQRTTRKEDVANMQRVQQDLQAQREQAKQGGYPAPSAYDRLQQGLKLDPPAGA